MQTQSPRATTETRDNLETPKRLKQSQPLRIEDPEVWSFSTSRTVNSALWFVNNPQLDNRILGYLAKYKQEYGVTLYAFCLQGSHDHLQAQYPNCNRAAFHRDFNARIAEAVRALVPEFPGGPLFERRYSEQAVPRPEDVEEQFFYCALQAVNDGLCERPEESPSYNSFWEAISGTSKQYLVIDYAGYNEAKRKGKSPKIRDYYHYYYLKYDRLPGYRNLSQKDYKRVMLRKLEERRLKIVQERKEAGLGFMGVSKLRAVKPGSLAKNPKKSTRESKRPLVLTRCLVTKKNYLEKYFSIYRAYKKACTRYLSGIVDAIFPPRTYRPPGLMVAA